MYNRSWFRKFKKLQILKHFDSVEIFRTPHHDNLLWHREVFCLGVCWPRRVEDASKKSSFQIVEQRWHLLATYSDLKVEFAYSPSGKCTLSSQTRPPQISRSLTFQAISWHHCAMHTILIKSGRKLCQSLSNRSSILVGRTLNFTKGTMDPVECFCSSQKRM